MPRKTYKREFATVFMGFTIGLYAWAMIEGPTEYGEWLLSGAKYLMIPAGLWSAAAFGLDWTSKQSPWRSE